MKLRPLMSTTYNGRTSRPCMSWFVMKNAAGPRAGARLGAMRCDAVWESSGSRNFPGFTLVHGIALNCRERLIKPSSTGLVLSRMTAD